MTGTAVTRSDKTAISVTATAPGKLVLSGEYVVLLGAPAVVLALDFPVRCQLSQSPQKSCGWHFLSSGFNAECRHTLNRLLMGPAPPPTDAARICWYVLQALMETILERDATRLPATLEVQLDSRCCYRQGRKLGVGSSAAVCSALCGALLTLLGCFSKTTAFELSRRAHRAFQGGHGSGLDIAAAIYGGSLEFVLQDDQALPLVKPLVLPDNGFLTLLWTGQCADTTSHVTNFLNWYYGIQANSGNDAAITRLTESATAFADALQRAPHAGDNSWIDSLQEYSENLLKLDHAAHLGIYSAAHTKLAELSTQHEMIYKPCGAGGGDLGIALGKDSATLQCFSAAVAREGFTLLPLEIEQHGLQTTVH